MDIECGDRVRTQLCIEGTVFQIESDKTTALVAIGEGMVGRFKLSELKVIDRAGDSSDLE